MEIERLLEIIDRLRGPAGCPWDREQTLETLKPYLVDEAYEVFSAINSMDRDNLTEELGDLLFHVLMLCRTAGRERKITLEAICRSIEEKMVRRHPHVFGDVQVNGVNDVMKNWEKIKAREKKRDAPGSLLDDSLKYLPALRRAQRIQQRAGRVGFDWREIAGVIAKVREELEEVEQEIETGDRRRQEYELGDLIFTVVNLVRFMGFDAELSLQKMINRWIRRFQQMEERAREEGRGLGELSLEELDAIWDKLRDE